MKQRLINLYSQLHTAATALARRSPVPTRVFGPPKGIIPDLKSWTERYRERRGLSADDCWYEMAYPPGLRRDFTSHPEPQTLPSAAPPFPSKRQVPQPECFNACIPRARVVTRTGIVISPDDRVFEQSCVFPEPVFTADIEYNTLRPMLKPVRLSGDFIVMASRFYSNYYHWLTDCATRLCIIDKLPEVPVLLPRKLSDWQSESLDLLGIEPARRLQLDEGCYEVDRLYFPFTGTTGNTHSLALQELRRRYSGERAPVAGKRLYVARSDAGYRRLVNEAEVARALEGEGFQIVEGSKLSLKEKVALFADAEIIVGVHGAGLASLIFAPPGSIVLEIHDPEHPVPSNYLLSASLEQRYWCLLGENESKRRGEPVRKGYDDVSVSLEELTRTLQAALSGNHL
jgi:capsular polysaccharide biosynthesis protein